MKTTIHLMRHGEVYNPDKVLYGRKPGFRLSSLGQEMASAAANAFVAGEHDLALVVASPPFARTADCFTYRAGI